MIAKYRLRHASTKNKKVCKSTHKSVDAWNPGHSVLAKGAGQKLSGCKSDSSREGYWSTGLKLEIRSILGEPARQ